MIKRMLLVSLSLVLINMPALAIEKPADGMIGSVQSDLSRYEPMVAQMQPRSRSAARVLRFVPIMESRLSSSRHKGSASWIETSNRLKVMKQTLLDIKSGKQVVAAAPTKAVASRATHRVAAPVQHDMSDPDRARKVDSLVRAFYNDFNRTKPRALGDDRVVSGFAQKIEVMKAAATGFHDPSLGYVQQVKDMVVESEQYFHKRTNSIRAQINANKRMQAGVAADNKRGQMAAQAASAKLAEKQPTQAQSDREIGAIHRKFARAFSSVRGSLVTLTAQRLANPENAKDWKYRVNKLAGIVDQYQDKNTSAAKQDIASYMAVKQRFDESVKELAKNAGANKAALLELQASNKQKQAAMEAQQHEEALNRQFSNVYRNLRISFPYLTAETLADPAEARKWTEGVAAMEAVVSQYQGMDSPKVKQNIATYEQVKSKVEAGLAANSAATGGLSTDDLLRDHQTLQALVTKYKPFFSRLDVMTAGNLDKIKTFKDNGSEAEIKRALAAFTQKYGKTRREIADKFTLVNGGRSWHSPERRVPESGFEPLSKWLDSLNAAQSMSLASLINSGDSKRAYAFPPTNHIIEINLAHPDFDLDRLNEDFKRYRNILDGVLKDYPGEAKATHLRGELDDVKRKYITGINKAIDAVAWKENTEDEFRGPGDVDELKDAAKEYVKKDMGFSDDDLLIFQLDGQWEVSERDIYKRPISYFLRFYYAVKHKSYPGTAHVYVIILETDEMAGKALPFVHQVGGADWLMRLKKLP